MKAALKSLRTLVSRVWRDIDRTLNPQDEVQCTKAPSIVARVKRLLEQKPKDKKKRYSLHAPEVECIGKWKARQPYEFGVKVTVATTHKEGRVVGMHSLPGNPYDAYTLSDAIEQVSILTNLKPKAVFVDKGYRGVSVDGVTISRSGETRSATPQSERPSIGEVPLHRRSSL